ncbi:MAG: energy-coupling factor transporter ATPase [Clostridium sp.]|nr:energy-coupling factor transporter ATPase [Clostridium sp.]MBP3214907.1 energy-coupling factor transporter ATPase [Clostridium sp.]MBQ4148977.1 energy-coupling factor transporter ATPase [Clostridium sp.]HAE80426.1 energy-coupling factor transporter ATPase [Lachnoclostridium sp.]
MDEIIRGQDLVYDYTVQTEDGAEPEVRRALDHLDIAIEKGSFVAILGHNGSGKSTLAKLINGIYTPTEGTLLVEGIDTRNEEQIWEVRRTAGMVFQNPDNQIIANVVEEDVGFGPENMGIPTEEILVRVDKALEAVGMTAFREASPNRLSGGQKQRVAIAGVLAMKPDCIVLDEPTAMLDPNGRKEVIKTIHELNKKENITILLITHYMEEAVDADRIIVMNDGQMAMDGTPAEIFSRIEELKALELDVPQVTELAWKLKQKGAALPDGILHKEELVEALYALME